MLTSHVDELNEVKLRSLESWAAVEEMKVRNDRKRDFVARSLTTSSAPLCPILSKQLSQIHTVKAYLSSSLADLELLLSKRRRETTLQQTGVKSVYQAISTNEKVLKYQENKIDALEASLAKLRLGRSQTNSPNRKNSNFKENNELPLTPNFMKSGIRPDQAQKLKKMFGNRKEIPIVPSPKNDSRQSVLKTINRRPESILQWQQEAQEEAIGREVPKLNLDETYDVTSNRTFDLNQTVKTRDSFGVVSYAPKGSPAPVPHVPVAQSTKVVPEKESKFNLNNPPQGIDYANLSYLSINIHVILTI
jgi:hypothetical protein